MDTDGLPARYVRAIQRNERRDHIITTIAIVFWTVMIAAILAGIIGAAFVL